MDETCSNRLLTMLGDGVEWRKVLSDEGYWSDATTVNILDPTF